VSNKPGPEQDHFCPTSGKVRKESASHLNLSSSLSINASEMDERSASDLTFAGLG
jgi:hypothetical protein